MYYLFVNTLFSSLRGLHCLVAGEESARRGMSWLFPPLYFMFFFPLQGFADEGGKPRRAEAEPEPEPDPEVKRFYVVRFI